jgi:predicted nucleic acid-binding protein
MNVLIDLNIVLDVLLKRQPWFPEAAFIWDANVKGQIRGHIVATSLTNLFYIARRILGTDDARRAVRLCLQVFAIVAVDGRLLQAADALPGLDFEDNVLVAAAATNHLDAIVTRDSTGFADSQVIVLTPAELIARIPQGAP